MIPSAALMMSGRPASGKLSADEKKAAATIFDPRGARAAFLMAM